MRLPRIGQLFVPPGTPDGYLPTVDTERLVFTAPPGGGGGGGWDQLLNLPLSTLTGWTAGAGAWSITSGVIRQATTTNAVYRLHCNTLIPQADAIVEVELKLDTTPNNVSSRGGIVFGTPRSSDGTGGHLVALLTNGSTTQATAMNYELDAITSLGVGAAISPAIANGTWTKFRVHKAGNMYATYLDDVYHDSFEIRGPQNAGRDFGRFALYAYAADVSFRNLKVWTPTQP